MKSKLISFKNLEFQVLHKRQDMYFIKKTARGIKLCLIFITIIVLKLLFNSIFSRQFCLSRVCLRD